MNSHMHQGFDQGLDSGLHREVCCRRCLHLLWPPVLLQLLLYAQLTVSSGLMATRTWVFSLRFLLYIPHQVQDCQLQLDVLLQLDETVSERDYCVLEQPLLVSPPCQRFRCQGQRGWVRHFRQPLEFLCELDSYAPTNLVVPSAKIVQTKMTLDLPPAVFSLRPHRSHLKCFAF